MAYLLDTHVWIELAHRNPTVVSRLGSVPTAEVALSPVVLGELALGELPRKREEARHSPRRSFVEALADAYSTLPLTHHTSFIYARIRRELENAGERIGANDLWIAAQALEHHLTVVTHNIREFSRIPELSIADWQLEP